MNSTLYSKSNKIIINHVAQQPTKGQDLLTDCWPHVHLSAQKGERLPATVFLFSLGLCVQISYYRNFWRCWDAIDIITYRRYLPIGDRTSAASHSTNSKQCASNSILIGRDKIIYNYRETRVQMLQLLPHNVDGCANFQVSLEIGANTSTQLLKWKLLWARWAKNVWVLN